MHVWGDYVHLARTVLYKEGCTVARFTITVPQQSMIDEYGFHII